MRKTSIIGIALAAIILLGGAVQPAAAQNAPLNFSNYMAWWDHLGCEKMLNVVNSLEINKYTGAVANQDGDHASIEDPSNPTARDSKRWCVKWSGLSATVAQDDADTVKVAVTTGANKITAAASGGFFNAQQWYSSGLDATQRQVALGYDEDPGDYPAASATGAAARLLRRDVDAAGSALSGATQTTDTDDDDDMDEAPALPLFATLALGSILAGRGWWVRRRR